MRIRINLALEQFDLVIGGRVIMRHAVVEHRLTHEILHVRHVRREGKHDATKVGGAGQVGRAGQGRAGGGRDCGRVGVRVELGQFWLHQLQQFVDARSCHSLQVLLVEPI